MTETMESRSWCGVEEKLDALVEGWGELRKDVKAINVRLLRLEGGTREAVPHKSENSKNAWRCLNGTPRKLGSRWSFIEGCSHKV